MILEMFIEALYEAGWTARNDAQHQNIVDVWKEVRNAPVICCGLPHHHKAHEEETVELSDATLIPDSILHNAAMQTTALIGDGEPASPNENTASPCKSFRSLSASQIVASLRSRPTFGANVDEIAGVAVKQADALIKALEKGAEA